MGRVAEHRQLLVVGIFLTMESHRGRIHSYPFFQGLSVAGLHLFHEITLLSLPLPRCLPSPPLPLPSPPLPCAASQGDPGELEVKKSKGKYHDCYLCWC